MLSHIQPEPYLKTEKETSGFDSLAVMTAEAPYRLPAKLDPGRIESILGSRKSAAEDYMWAMREGPAYFVEQLLEVKEHRQEVMKDFNGENHPTLKAIHQTPLWARVCRTIVFETYLRRA